MRNLVVKLTALTAMTLVMAAGAYQFSQPVAAAAQLCSNTCYKACQSAGYFCRNNPDGYWNNGYIGGPCSEFPGVDACCKWECPNTWRTNSRCLFNTTFPGCVNGTDPSPTECNSNGQLSCVSLCNEAVDMCQNGGRCAGTTVSSTSGSGSCLCSYTVECYP